MEEALGDPDKQRAERAMQAMLGMGKIDVAARTSELDSCLLLTFSLSTCWRANWPVHTGMPPPRVCSETP